MTTSATSREPRRREGSAAAASVSGELQPGQDLLDYAKAYARQKPEVFALWCFGVGFIVGWKLKLW